MAKMIDIYTAFMFVHKKQIIMVKQTVIITGQVGVLKQKKIF